MQARSGRQGWRLARGPLTGARSFFGNTVGGRCRNRSCGRREREKLTLCSLPVLRVMRRRCSGCTSFRLRASTPWLLELHRLTCLRLDDDGTVADLATQDQITGIHLHHVAASELAVDRKIEERAVTLAAMLIEKEAYRPNLPGFQRTLRSRVRPASQARRPASTGSYSAVSMFLLARPWRPREDAPEDKAARQPPMVDQSCKRSLSPAEPMAGFGMSAWRDGRPHWAQSCRQFLAESCP